MNPTYDLHGQVALVTGAGSGMGRDTVNAFATAGAAVVLADIDEDPLRAATDELTASGHRALGIACDLSDETQVAALVERTAEAFGRLDMAFNNAGIQAPPTDAADEPAESFDRVGPRRSAAADAHLPRPQQRREDRAASPQAVARRCA